MGKKLLVISEIMFALVFVVMLALTFSGVLKFGTNTNNDILNMQDVAAMSELTPFDGGVVSGDAVISAINKVKSTKTGTKLNYLVVNGSTYTAYGCQALAKKASSNAVVYDKSGSTVSNVGFGTLTTYKSYDLSLRPGDATFINPLSEYKGTLIYSKNKTFLGVLFIKQ